MLKHTLSILMVLIVMTMAFWIGLSVEQTVILSSTAATIILWVTGAVRKLYSSLFLLLAFLIFSELPVNKVFHFPLSANFVTILFSFLFSQGILNSGLSAKLVQPLIEKYTLNTHRFMAVLFLAEILFIFIIPQPFSRVILLAMIFSEFLERKRINAELKSILLFWIFASSAFVNMFLIRGDIILNNAILIMGNLDITEFEWIKAMTVPSFVFYLLAAAGFLFTFRKKLSDFSPLKEPPSNKPKKLRLTAKEKTNLIIILAVIVLWAVEDFHKIHGAIIVTAGTALMFAVGMLGKKDIKSVNFELMVFLTAAFAIGPALEASGVSSILFSKFSNLIPRNGTLMPIVAVTGISMFLHMILGSNITTMSIVVPGLASITSGIIDPKILIFLIYTSICSHFFFPFHHVIIIIGEGNEYFKSGIILRYAKILTLIVLFSIIVVYRGWWSLIF